MEVYLNSIQGIDDAIVSMYVSKRTLTKELENDIRLTCYRYFDRFGNRQNAVTLEDKEKVERWIKTLLKWGKRHITMLKFIDLSFTVYGLHRAGQDDWDSHAARFDNRIIRSSTRLAEYGPGEVSEWYKDKIITTDDILKTMDIELPGKVINSNGTFIRTVNGYIREDLVDDKDAKRGLYMLSIPSNFVFKVNLAQFAHVYQQRNAEGTANPEVKQLAEECFALINRAIPQIDRGLLMKVEN